MAPMNRLVFGHLDAPLWLMPLVSISSLLDYPQPMESNERQLKRSTKSMRLKKEREGAAGFRRSTVALSPVAVAIAERLQKRLGLSSREAVINAVFERIDTDLYVKYEFLGPEGFRCPPTAHLHRDPEASDSDEPMAKSTAPRPPRR